MIQKLLAALRGPAPEPLDIPADPAAVLSQYITAVEAMETASATIKKLNRPSARAMKTIRKVNKLTMRDIAERAGISAPYYSDLENSHRRITPSVLKKLRKVFNL